MSTDGGRTYSRLDTPQALSILAREPDSDVFYGLTSVDNRSTLTIFTRGGREQRALSSFP